MPTPTREQLASIEWAAEWDREPMCPACRNLEHDCHAPDCWLAACLAAPPPEPQSMPPIAFDGQLLPAAPPQEDQ